MITHIHGVTVYVADQDRAAAFFRDALGFEVTRGEEWGPGDRWVTVGPENARTNLILHEAPPEMADVVGVWTGIVFYTDNIQKAYEGLKSRGVHFTRTPAKMDRGGIGGQFTDPDGNKYELVQPQL